MTQPLTEMSTRKYFPEDKGGCCIGLTTLPPSCAYCLGSLGASTSWKLQGLSWSVPGITYLCLCLVYNYSGESRSGGEGMWLGTECFLYPSPSPKIRVNCPALSKVTIKKQHTIYQYSQSLPAHFVNNFTYLFLWHVNKTIYKVIVNIDRYCDCYTSGNVSRKKQQQY